MSHGGEGDAQGGGAGAQAGEGGALGGEGGEGGGHTGNQESDAASGGAGAPDATGRSLAPPHEGRDGGPDELLALGLDPADLAHARRQGFTVLERRTLPFLGLVVTRLGLPRVSPCRPPRRACAPPCRAGRSPRTTGTSRRPTTRPRRAAPAPPTVLGEARDRLALHARLRHGQRRRPDRHQDRRRGTGARRPRGGHAQLPGRGRAAGRFRPRREPRRPPAGRRAGRHGHGAPARGQARRRGRVRRRRRARPGRALEVAEALDWMAGLRPTVVNTSFAGPDNPVLAAAIAAVLARGVPVVAAAGNGGPEAPPAYPAAYPGVIAATAVDRQMRPYGKANRGDYVAFAAPGVDVAAGGAALRHLLRRRLRHGGGRRGGDAGRPGGPGRARPPPGRGRGRPRSARQGPGVRLGPGPRAGGLRDAGPGRARARCRPQAFHHPRISTVTLVIRRPMAPATRKMPPTLTSARTLSRSSLISFPAYSSR